MLIKNAMIVTMDSQRRIIKNGDILIEGNKIKEVGKNIDIRDDDVIDATKMVALPGFIKSHTHSPMTLMRGYADDLPLMTWLNDYIWPLESKLKENDCYVGGKLACLEMIKAGITTFCDIYFFMKGVSKAVKEAGIRGFLSEGMIDNLPFGKIETAKKFLEEVQRDGVTPIVGVHSPYACSEDTLIKAKEIAEELNTVIHIHVCETRQEIQNSLKKRGMRPIEYLNSINFLSENVLIAHCVWPSPNELRILARNNVKIAHCPVSNMKLASGVAPLKYMIENGLIISLGSDGPCSNNRLDMIQEMRFCSLLQKVSLEDPTIIPAQEALEMATINGAKALRIEDKLGSIENGKLADIILIDLEKPHLTPMYNVLSHLVYAAQASDVNTVISNGKILMRDRKVLTLNEKETMEKAELTKDDLISR